MDVLSTYASARFYRSILEAIEFAHLQDWKSGEPKSDCDCISLKPVSVVLTRGLIEIYLTVPKSPRIRML